MKLGTSTCLCSKRRDKDGFTYPEQVKFCADAGFKVIDMNFCDSIHGRTDGLAADDWEKQIGELGELGARLGVEFTQSHAPFNPYFFIRGKQPNEEYMTHYHEMLRRSTIASGMLGVKWMTVHLLNDNINGEYDRDVNRETNKRFFEPYVELAKKNNVGIAYENMFNALPKILKRFYADCTEDLIDIVDSYGDDSVGVTWDFGHAHFMYMDQPRALRELGGRLKSTHVQDNLGVEYDLHLIPFVGGTIKWESIMPALKEINYQGDFVYETHRYINDFPTDLAIEAARFAHTVGEYCMELYNKA